MAIYIHDEAARLRLCVTGDLDDDSAKELASCWSTASSVVGDRRIVLDLTALDAAHDSGRQLLEALHREGVEFLAQSESQQSLVAEITGAKVQQSSSDRSVSRWLKGLMGVSRA